MALTGVAVFGPTLYLGLRYTTTVNATLINGLGPLITGLLAALLIGEPMTRRQVGGAVVGLAGIGVLISGGSLAFWRAGRAQRRRPDHARRRGAVGTLLGAGPAGDARPLGPVGHGLFRVPGVAAAADGCRLGGVQVLPPNSGPKPCYSSSTLASSRRWSAFWPGTRACAAWAPAGRWSFTTPCPSTARCWAYLFLGEPVGPAHLLGGALIVGGGLWAARG